MAILRRIRDVMVPESRLLVHEHVVPEEAAPGPEATGYDLTMMVMVGGRERTAQDWRRLLNATGFQVSRIWSSEGAPQSIVEATLAENAAEK